MEKIRFVKAREEDTDLVLETLNEATQYKNEHSDDAWGSESWQEREIADSIEAGNRYLVYMGSEVVGSFVLDWTGELWADDCATAAYIHQLALNSNFHGLNIGSKMLDMATIIAKENGKTVLRLDCNYENKKLHEYYEQMNFMLQGTVKSKSANHTIALLQKDI